MYEILENKNDQDYETFIKTQPSGNILQSSLWAAVKKGWGHRIIVSRDETGKITAGIMVLIRRVPVLPYTFLYAPRGPVCESDNKAGMMDLAAGIKALAKKERAYIFKSDPAVLSSDDIFRKNITDAGFSIREVGKNFDGIQPRYVFRLDIKNKTLDEVFAGFQSKTRYNIRLAERRGVVVEIGERADLEEFHRIMQQTGERDNFTIRPLSYFEQMYDTLAPAHLRLYTARLNGEMIAATIALFYGDKTWYLYGASANAHRNVMPNYLLQWKMIQWAVEEKCNIYDFRGVSGDLNPENPLYGLYKFKKGFSGELMEFIGELEMIFHPVVNIAANLIQKII